MAMWLESDRMGYLINTVTQNSFALQQNVVQNEKREGVDNRPYGFTDYVLLKNLYPAGHPYSWDVIGEMEDLKNATIEDVKAFHNKFYIPNNATLVVSGDYDAETIKAMIEKYFGEIPAGEQLKDPEPMNITLNETKKLFHEDNFANAPQYTMVFPTNQQFTKDSYSLNVLAQLLGEDKKSPLFKVLVKDKKLTSGVSARLFLLLREEKGYTYGAYSGFDGQEKYGTFYASASVRSDATRESVNLFKEIMTNYRSGATQEFVDFTKSSLLKGNARRFETNDTLLNMLKTMKLNGLPEDYIKKEEDYLRGLTVAQMNETLQKYIDPMRMYYVVVGDAKTQLKNLEKVGLGKPVLVKN